MYSNCYFHSHASLQVVIVVVSVAAIDADEFGAIAVFVVFAIVVVMFCMMVSAPVFVVVMFCKLVFVPTVVVVELALWEAKLSNCSVVILVVLDLKFSVELELMIFGAKVDVVVVFKVTLALLLL